jgi:hypothetical protein
MSNKNKSVASKKVGRKKIEKLLQLGEKKAGVNGMVYILCVL